MDKFIQTKGQKLLFATGVSKYPYLLEVTEFVKNSDNTSNYSGEREFRLLDENFVATGDCWSMSNIPDDYKKAVCDHLHTVYNDQLHCMQCMGCGSEFGS